MRNVPLTRSRIRVAITYVQLITRRASVSVPPLRTRAQQSEIFVNTYICIKFFIDAYMSSVECHRGHKHNPRSNRPIRSQCNIGICQ